MLVADRTFNIQEFDVPRTLDPGWALLRVEASGLCGTDVHQYQGVMARWGMYDYPIIPGHEPVGWLEQVSPEATAAWGVAAGDRVGVESRFGPCGSCAHCAAGVPTACERRGSYGFVSTTRPPSLWGSYAEYLVLAPGTGVHRIAEHVTTEDAVLFNALAGSISWSIRTAGTSLGDDVLLLGLGQRGFTSILALKEAGAARIIVASRGLDPHKFEIARALGATHTVSARDGDIADAVLEITGGTGADVVIDFTPARDALRTAVRAVRQSGTIVVVGTKDGDALLPSDDAMRKDLTIRATTGADRHSYAQAARLLGSGRFSLESLHSHRFALDQVDVAIRTLAGDVEGATPTHVTLSM